MPRDVVDAVLDVLLVVHLVADLECRAERGRLVLRDTRRPICLSSSSQRGRRELPVGAPLGPGQGADHVGERAEAEHEESAEKQRLAQTANRLGAGAAVASFLLVKS